MNELISIIVPVYNIREYITECVNSLLSQTFSNIEIILVNDGSTDGSKEICEKLSYLDNRIVLVNQKNQGLSNARNNGLKIARGRFICFVDGDDYISPIYCETLYKLLIDNSYDFSVCGVCRFEDKSEVIDNNISDDIIISSNFDYLKRQLHKYTEFGVWNKMYRKESLKNLLFMPNKIHEDVIFSGDLAKQLKNGVIETTKKLYFYRQRPNSIMASSAVFLSSDFIYAGCHLMKICEEHTDLELKTLCVQYTISYPWSFVDKIYVKKLFKKNKCFLDNLQLFIRKYRKQINDLTSLSDTIKYRINLFGTSKLLYTVNVIYRLIRVIIFNALRINPYENEKGI